MKAAFKRFAQKKGIVTSMMIIAGLVLVTLPSCKTHQGGCDAYQGSQRSFKKNKHRSAQVETVRNNAFTA